MKNIISFCLVSLVWGLSFVFARVAVTEASPIAITFWRIFLATCLLLPVAINRHGIKILFTQRKLFFYNSIIAMSVPFIIFSFSSVHLSAGFNGILNATMPICTAIIGYLLFKRKLNKLQIIGFIIGFLGVLLLNIEVLLLDNGMWYITLLVLIATFMYGLSVNYIQAQDLDGLTIAAGSLFYASISLLPLWLIFDFSFDYSANIWFNIIALGVASTAFAYILFFPLVQSIGAAKASIAIYFVPLVAIFFGILLLDEKLTLLMIIGGLLILFGAILATNLLQKKGVKEPSA